MVFYWPNSEQIIQYAHLNHVPLHLDVFYVFQLVMQVVCVVSRIKSMNFSQTCPLIPVVTSLNSLLLKLKKKKILLKSEHYLTQFSPEF